VERMVIAVDVDGTLFDGHVVAPAAIAALERARADGHLLVIVTGRRWETLPDVIGSVLALFHRVVGEEGGYLADVASGTVRPLVPAVEQSTIDALHAEGAEQLDIGRATVGGRATQFDAFAAVCAQTNGAWRVVLNKDSVALVRGGHDKATGLRAALVDLGAVGAFVIAIGDAVNDLPMFAAASAAVGVANSDDGVRAAGIELTRAPFGDGVAEALLRYLPSN
jgi:HAD superfamily hydrolase (TIGR01484 family)